MVKAASWMLFNLEEDRKGLGKFTPSGIFCADNSFEHVYWSGQHKVSYMAHF